MRTRPTLNDPLKRYHVRRNARVNCFLAWRGKYQGAYVIYVITPEDKQPLDLITDEIRNVMICTLKTLLEHNAYVLSCICSTSFSLSLSVHTSRVIA